MKAIVRVAQRDHDFASIYEMRRTNQILISGFTSLTQALDQMSYQVTSSVGSLVYSVDAMTTEHRKGIDAIHSQIGESTESSERYYNEAMMEAADRASREEKVIKMLEGIQSRSP
jgi:hypothetical protein